MRNRKKSNYNQMLRATKFYPKKVTITIKSKRGNRNQQRLSKGMKELKDQKSMKKSFPIKQRIRSSLMMTVKLGIHKACHHNQELNNKKNKNCKINNLS